MADDLEPVRQEFESDWGPWIASMEAAIEESRRLAEENKTLQESLSEDRDKAVEAGDALHQFGIDSEQASALAGEMRDRAAETGVELNSLRDHALEAAEAEAKLRDDALEAAAALGHERDDALEAAAATDAMSEKSGRLHDVMTRLRDIVDSTKDKIGSVKDNVDRARNGLETLGSAGTRVGSLLSNAFGEGSQVGNGFSKLTEQVGKMPVSLIAIVPAVEALLPELTGVVSGFAAAGAGAAAFGILAIPAFKAVTTAYTKINTDQKAYDNALTATAKNTALKKLQQDYKDLDPAERGAVTGIQNLMTTYHRMAKAFEPDAFKIFNDGLRIANTLLPDVLPFATTFSNVLDGLLKRADKFASSKGFKDWLEQFHKLEGPSLEAIGNGIGKIAVAIGHLLTVMSAKDVVNALNIAFTVLATTINILTSVVHRIMTNWDQMSSAYRKSAHAISSDTDTMRSDFVGFGHDVEKIFNEVKGFIGSATSGIVTDFKKVGSEGASVWHTLESDTDAMREKFVSFGHGVESVFNTVKSVVSGAGHALESDADAMANKFVSVGHRIESIWNSVISFFRGIPGKASSALNALPGDLQRIGENAINAMLRGIESAAGGLIGEAESIASKVSGAFAKVLHILSPSRVFMSHGANIVLGLIQGLRSYAPQAVSMVQSLASQITAAGSAAPSMRPGALAASFASGSPASGSIGGSSGGAAAASGNIVVQVEGQTLFQIAKSQLYQYNIRNSGQVTGVVKPAG